MWKEVTNLGKNKQASANHLTLTGQAKMAFKPSRDRGP